MSTDPTKALLRLVELSFEGAGTYRRNPGPLPLQGQGCVLICGEEGAGKSMIPEVMTLILYGKGSPRVHSKGAARPKSLSESTIVNAVTGYKGNLLFESGFGTAAQTVEIEQAHKYGRKALNRYRITIDGVRDRTSGKPAQKRLVKRLAPLSYEEWLGVVYLHQGGIHDLLAGAPKEKREYLTSVFGLDFYDDLVFVTAEELKSLKKIAEGAPALEQRLVDLQKEVREQEELLAAVPGGIQEVEAGITKRTKRLQTLSKKIGNVEAQQQTAESYKAIVDQIMESEGPKTKAKAAAALKKLRTEEGQLLQQVAEDKAVLQGIEAQQKAYRKLQRAAEDAADELATRKKTKKLAADAVKGLPKRAVLEKTEQAVLRVLQKGADPNLGLSDKTRKARGDWLEHAAEARTALNTAERLRKLLDKGHSNCPTCNHEVDDQELEKMRTDLHDQATAALKEVVNGVSLELLQTTNWWVEHRPLTLNKLHLRTVKGLEAWDTLQETTAALSKAEETAQEAAAEFAEAEAPKSSEGLAEAISAADERLEEIDEESEALADLLKLWEQADALKKAAEGIDLAALDEEAATLKAQKAKARKRFEKASAIKAEYDQAQGALEELNKQVEYVVRKLNEHAENLAKIKHYEITLVPYFNALRAAKVRACASVLEGVLPVYVGAMAGGQYAGAEVKLELSDDLKQMDLKLRTEKHGPWLSAIQTSGGQRRRFTLALIAALREVSPRRANIMFFDEPFSDLQAEGKLLFVNKLLPTLLDRCEDLDSIFVIAHDKEVLESANDAFDSVWVAERDNRMGSTLLLDQKLAQVVGR